jgi:hypothetical protein
MGLLNRGLGFPMTPEETERMNQLCAQIKTEKDPQKFDALVRELNDLLEQKHERIHPDHKPN